MLFIFKLPFPPSVNTYYSVVNNRKILSAKGRQYKKDVIAAIGIDAFSNEFPLLDKLSVRIEIYAPDRRRRDIDNCAKAVLDAVGGAGIYKDDCQIDHLVLERKEVCKSDGYVVVAVSVLDESCVQSDSKLSEGICTAAIQK